ncbi:MAG TPA: thioredoxin domain-containing protein [Pirellulales bacterium]|jgi:thiol-disulfide isomerase/thioredoxin
MFKSFKSIVASAAALAAVVIASRAQAERKPLPELRIGSPAPEIKVAKWLKGTPVAGFKDGEVYVMEFWATWCGPCIKAMPHVTELAKKYEGKATFVGTSVWERPDHFTNEAILELVEPFVNRQGDKMVYNVAAEGTDHTMSENWLRAAGQTGIPCTMIVGRDKKIAWIGHPMEMDKPLAEIVAGTFDMKASAEEFAKKWEEKQEIEELLSGVVAAMKEKDYPKLLAEIDKAVAAKPALAGQLTGLKFEALLMTDDKAFAAALAKMDKAESAHDNPSAVYNIYLAMRKHDGKTTKPEWVHIANVLGRVNEQLKDEEPLLLSAYAHALVKADQIDRAIEMQKKAIELAATKMSEPSRTSWIKLRQQELAEYELLKEDAK